MAFAGLHKGPLMFRLVCIFLLVLTTIGTHRATADATFESDFLRLTVDDQGQVVDLLDKANEVQYAAVDQPSPLLQIRLAGDDPQFISPQRMTFDNETGRITLQYGEVRAVIQCQSKATHINFELVDISPATAVDRVQWGPISTKINTTVSEVIGVVRNDDFAIGLQVLNVKTIGGPSENEEGRMSSRGRTAISEDWGSTLQAYTIDRSRPRFATVWGEHYKNMPVPPIPGETAIGSKIALFGCPADKVLERIGRIGVAEGLPHPIIDGKWARMNREISRAYLIIDFNEKNIEEILDFAERGGFMSVYHGGPFKSWGHYELRNDQFPNGTEGMKAIVKAAEKRGIRIGVHTLTNFINTSDPYITPVPDPRLARTGSSVLVKDIDADQTQIEIASPEYFNNNKANWMRTVMIGGELIRYGRVSDAPPWKLLDCQRGAWRTKASSHKANEDIGKLMDHPYQTFFPNFEMQHEIAIRLATFMNETGVSHLDFDGFEGCWASGQGTFAKEVFAKTFYDHLEKPVIVGTSQISPYFWRINTNTNWGEPWYGSFRGSMAEYRFNNQALYDRNFMPNMMGWFSFTSQTTVADIEWLMARNAGFDAGFALTANLGTLRNHPQCGDILDTIHTWETLRLANAFTKEQRQRMRNPDNACHLTRDDQGAYLLHASTTSRMFEHERIIRQPGEPTSSHWEYDSSKVEQPLQFTITATGKSGAISDVVIEFDRFIRFEADVTIQHGQTLVCDGTMTLRILDANGQTAKTMELDGPPPVIPAGKHEVAFSCTFEGDTPPVANVQFKSRAAVETIPFNPSKPTP